MRYGIIKKGVLVEKLLDATADTIEIPDDAICGQLYDGVNFTNPPPTPPTYREKRAAEYPDSIADLMDEALGALDAAGLIPANSKLRAMQDARLVIKDKHKP